MNMNYYIKKTTAIERNYRKEEIRNGRNSRRRKFQKARNEKAWED